MKILKKLILKQLPLYIIAIIAMFIVIGFDIVTPLITRDIIDNVIVDGKLALLSHYLIVLLLIGIGRFIFPYVKEFFFDMAGSKVACELRKKLLSHIQGLSSGYFEKNSTGELMARVKDDVDRIWDGLTFVSFLTIQVVFQVIAIIISMIRLNGWLTIAPVLAMTFCGFLAFTMENKMGKVYGEISEENAALNRVAGENLSGVRTVKAFAKEKYEIKKFLEHNQKYYELNIENNRIFVKYYPYFQLVSKLLPVIILLIGGFIVIQGNMTIGTLSAFITYAMNIIWPMEMLGWLTDAFSTTIASGKKLNVIFSEKPDILESEEPEIVETVTGHIKFEHVSFHKEDGIDILSDINFEVEPGKTIGIMGSTGAGKSSLLLLLQRFYDPYNGSISIDGVNIKDMTFKQLRQSIAVVSQDVFLFSDTIEENIKLGQSNKLDIKTVQHASDNSLAREFIEKLDQKYDTIIGERGVGLSGGQKQRLSIARALSKDAPILVLDDSTSALDMETEHEIWRRLHALKNTTKLIITHRISAVSKADEIIILDDGKIIERGTHASLLDQKGYYYQTYLAQYGSHIPEELEAV